MTDLDASMARINELTEQLSRQRDRWKARGQTAESIIAKIRATNPELVEMAEAMVKQDRGETANPITGDRS